MSSRDAAPGRNGTVSYDLLKEVSLALAGTLVLVLILAAVLSSPDVPAETIQSWARSDPVDFTTTAAQELQGTTISAQYGPPYNDGTGSVQSLGFFSPPDLVRGAYTCGFGSGFRAQAPFHRVREQSSTRVRAAGVSDVLG